MHSLFPQRRSVGLLSARANSLCGCAFFTPRSRQTAWLACFGTWAVRRAEGAFLCLLRLLMIGRKREAPSPSTLVSPFHSRHRHRGIKHIRTRFVKLHMMLAVFNCTSPFQASIFSKFPASQTTVALPTLRVIRGNNAPRAVLFCAPSRLVKYKQLLTGFHLRRLLRPSSSVAGR